MCLESRKKNMAWKVKIIKISYLWLHRVLVRSRRCSIVAVNNEGHLKSMSIIAQESFAFRMCIQCHISFLYTFNALCYRHFSISGLQKQLGFPHSNAYEISHMTLNLSFLLKSERNSYFTATASKPLILFSLSWMSFFLWQQLPSLFQLCYDDRKLKFWWMSAKSAFS
jgi:hypothetical protein